MSVVAAIKENLDNNIAMTYFLCIEPKNIPTKHITLFKKRIEIERLPIIMHWYFLETGCFYTTCTAYSNDMVRTFARAMLMDVSITTGRAITFSLSQAVDAGAVGEENMV